ncbi:MAG: glycosyltransferase [Candidatus Competibacterales bacterium]
MRVLHIGKYFAPFTGGIERFMADLMAALTRQGVANAAIVHRHDRGPGMQQPAGIYRAPRWRQMLYTPISPTFPRWLERAIDEFVPDLLAFHLPNPSALWALRVGAARGLPWVVHWHADIAAGHDWRLALAYGGYRPLERHFLARARAVVVTSPPYLASSRALAPWRDKCRVIPLGLEPQRLARADARTQALAATTWGDAPHRILAVGRLAPYKGFDVLIEAVASLADTRVLIVGEGEGRRPLERLIDALGLRDRVQLLGFQPDTHLGALFQSCDIFCLPSTERTEAFGVVLLEAMGYGKAVVASAIAGSGVGWVVERAGHGHTVPPKNAAALRQTLVALLRDGELRQRLADRGRRALAEQFHIDHIATQTRQLYGDVAL